MVTPVSPFAKIVDRGEVIIAEPGLYCKIVR